LSEAGRAIVAAELDVMALCRLIADQAARIIDTDTYQIGLFDEDMYEITYWSIDGQLQETPKSFDLSEKSGLVGWVRDSKRSLLVQDFQKEGDTLPAQPSYIKKNPPRSALFLPLISGNQVLGIMGAQSPRPKAYSQRELEQLTILANQAGAAIANARMYQQERTKSAYLELVGQIAHQVSAINDLDELLNQVVELTHNTFSFGSVNIFIADGPEAKAIIKASTIAQLEADSLQLEPGVGLVGTAVATQETTLSNNTRDDVRFLVDELSLDTRAEIAIPLIVDQELLGVLDVQSPVVGAFTSQERSILEALAAQIALAINKAQQLEFQRQQSWITMAQLQVAKAVGQAGDLELLSQTLVRLTALLVGANKCVLLLWDKDFQIYQVAAEFGIPELALEGQNDFEIGLGQWRALDAVHVGGEQLTSRQSPPWSDSDRQRSKSQQNNREYLLQPLLAQGRVLAVMVIEDFDAVDPPEQGGRSELLQNIANQGAQAIDNVQLQLAQQEEAWVNTALLQVAEAVNKLTDLNEILDSIVRLVPMLIGVRSCIVLIRDETQQTYRAGPSYGLSEMSQGLLASFEVDLSEFPLLETQDMERIGPDAAYYTFKLPEWMHTIMESETADIFPLHARAKLVGALVVGPTLNGRPLTGRRLNIVSGIAQQAAIAVVNDQLYKESAERDRIEQELDVARSIQASLIPQHPPAIPSSSVATYWQAARQVSGDFFDFMSLAEGRWGIAIADVADKGVPAALFMALSRTILRTVAFNRLSPAAVLERTNQLIFGDTTSDLFVTVFYAVWDPDSKTLTYASGGHNPPVLIRQDGSISLLSAKGIALGVLEDIEVAQEQIELSAGDLIVFYTDGVTEAMNEDYDEFGMERLCMVAREAHLGDASAVVEAITAAVADHAGDTPQFDDITLVVMKYE
jgi:serine phosphatase RsbU (regulator of sigma subunit)/putative methionine-R-sulfoxide reductase with GAF domain